MCLFSFVFLSNSASKSKFSSQWKSIKRHNNRQQKIINQKNIRKKTQSNFFPFTCGSSRLLNLKKKLFTVLPKNCFIQIHWTNQPLWHSHKSYVKYIETEELSKHPKSIPFDIFWLFLVTNSIFYCSARLLLRTENWRERVLNVLKEKTWLFDNTQFCTRFCVF